MPSPILARADALMQRRVSSPLPEHDGTEDFPILTDAFDEEENIPILLQVESAPENAAPSLAPAPATPQATAPDSGPACLAADLAQALEAHLKAALPALIERAVADVLAHRAPNPETGNITDTRARKTGAPQL